MKLWEATVTVVNRRNVVVCETYITTDSQNEAEQRAALLAHHYRRQGFTASYTVQVDDQLATRRAIGGGR